MTGGRLGVRAGSLRFSGDMQGATVCTLAFVGVVTCRRLGKGKNMKQGYVMGCIFRVI